MTSRGRRVCRASGAPLQRSSRMIRLESVSKQHGGRILFLDASMAVFRGEKVGLVGPNGAGKSTIFRMIVGEEEPDSGSVITEKRVSIGYLSQSVGEIGGRSVL